MKFKLFVSMVVILVIVAGCAPVSGAQTNTPVPTAQINTAVPTAQINKAVPIVPSVTPAQTGVQVLPNMGQQISPLAVAGSQFENLNPDLSDNPAWLAGQAVTGVVSPDHKTLLVLTSGYNRIFRTDGVPDAYGSYFNWADSKEYVFIYDISTTTPVKKQVVGPKYLQRDCLRPIRRGFLRIQRHGGFPLRQRRQPQPRQERG